MKLVKNTDHLSFKWKDVTFSVRAMGTAEDKFEINAIMGVHHLGGKKMKPPMVDVFKCLIERFVVGWEGVTDHEGRAVPFSLEALYALPPDHDEDVIMSLGAFISNRCGLFPRLEESEQKKG